MTILVTKLAIIISSTFLFCFMVMLLSQHTLATDIRANSTNHSKTSPSDIIQGASNTTTNNITTNNTNLPLGTLQIPYIGIETITMTPKIAGSLGFNESARGIIVTEVHPDSPAEKAGIRGSNITSSVFGNVLQIGGDTILAVDGNQSSVKSKEVFERFIEDKKVGEKITLTTVHNGKIVNKDLVIGSLPAFYWYENPDEGIRIQYPSDWTVSEDSLNRDEIVKFFSAEKEQEDTDIATAVVIVKILPANDDTTLNTLALQERQGSSLKRNLYVEPTTIGDLPAYLSVSYKYLNGTTQKSMSAFTIKDESIYRVEFYAETPRYGDYLPLALEMIRSVGFMDQKQEVDIS